MPMGRRLITLYIAMIINILICTFELVFAIRYNSVALKADAFHALSDAIATKITIKTIINSRKPTTTHATYGWGRSEIIGGFANSVFLLALIFNICIEALFNLIFIDKVKEDLGHGIDSVLIVALIGFALNIGVAILVHYGHIEKPDKDMIDIKIIDTDTKVVKKESNYMKRQKINTQGLWLHIIGDMLGSIVVIISSSIIKYGSGENRFYVDPCASLFTICVVYYVTIPLLRECLRILMQSAPNNIDMEQLKTELLDSSDNVRQITSFHVWQLDDETLLADVRYDAGMIDGINQGTYIMATINEMKKILKTYGIEKVTIQPELK